VSLLAFGQGSVSILVTKKNTDRDGTALVGKKVSYKVKNWGSYNKALINRGNITLWFDEESLARWYASPSAKQGRPQIYSDTCIELMLTLRSLFHFPLRATQGFLVGLMQRLGLGLKVPHYSRLSRRALKINFRTQGSSSQRITDVVVDSTGLKIYGEGEWKMRIHGKAQRRTWRKLHIAACADSFEIVSLELTDAKVQDDHVIPWLLKDLTGLKNVYADGAYISRNCFDAIAKTGAKAKIALRSGTSIVEKKKISVGELLRNELVREIWKAGGKTSWKKASDYHRRSLAETQMFRFKKILGGTMSDRRFENQIREATLKVKILNRMTRLGMPDSHKVSG
jgi:hypothetical protein